MDIEQLLKTLTLTQLRKFVCDDYRATIKHVQAMARSDVCELIRSDEELADILREQFGPKEEHESEEEEEHESEEEPESEEKEEVAKPSKASRSSELSPPHQLIAKMAAKTPVKVPTKTPAKAPAKRPAKKV